jgi:hypothetical protein
MSWIVKQAWQHAWCDIKDNKFVYQDGNNKKVIPEVEMYGEIGKISFKKQALL